MDLKTHSAYKEVMVDHETGNWVCRFITGTGEVVETFSGNVETGAALDMNKAAGAAAKVAAETLAGKYIRT